MSDMTVQRNLQQHVYEASFGKLVCNCALFRQLLGNNARLDSIHVVTGWVEQPEAPVMSMVSRRTYASTATK